MKIRPSCPCFREETVQSEAGTDSQAQAHLFHKTPPFQPPAQTLLLQQQTFIQRQQLAGHGNGEIREEAPPQKVRFCTLQRYRQEASP